MILALLVVSLLLICAGITVARPSRVTAFALVVVCAIWLPVNNGRLEGPTLFAVDSRHGLTVADLFAYAGFVLAASAVLRWWREALRRPAPAALRSGNPGLYVGLAACTALGGLVVILGSGLALAYAHQA